MSAGGPRLVRIADRAELANELQSNGIELSRPVLVCIGGADALDGDQVATLTAMFQAYFAPALDEWSATVVDGGTDAGVMRMVGRAKAGAGRHFPLIGVAAIGTVDLPGSPGVADDTAPLEPHHTQVVLVPGAAWGDETPWISAVAGEIARDQRSVTLLVNGGAIALNDAQASLDAGRPLVVLAGSGRSADEIAAARAGDDVNDQAKAIAASPLTSVCDSGNPRSLLETIARALHADR